MGVLGGKDGLCGNLNLRLAAGKYSALYVTTNPRSLYLLVVDIDDHNVQRTCLFPVHDVSDCRCISRYDLWQKTSARSFTDDSGSECPKPSVGGNMKIKSRISNMIYDGEE